MRELHTMMGFVTTTDIDRAKAFYSGVLSFPLLSEDPYGATFEANGSRIRIAKAQAFTPAVGTVLGWAVTDIRATLRVMRDGGVTFEQFGLAFLTQDADGIWDAGNGDFVAWFKDPDGNVLSISQHAV